MKHHIPIKRLEYCMADPGAAAAGREIRNQHSIEAYIGLTTIDIDFEKRNLCFEGEGIKVKTAIYPGVDASDRIDDVVVFSLEGTLENGKTITRCSGLLVLQCVTAGKRPDRMEWRLTAFLYDDYNDEQEIKFDLTMLPISENAELN